MTTYADLWLHIADVDQGTDGLLFDVLEPVGFPTTSLVPDAHHQRPSWQLCRSGSPGRR